jgi:glycosyltransferase involved in cell wall biosynthesis
MFGKDSIHKHLPSWIMNLVDERKDLIPHLLRGMWIGDGCFAKEGMIYSTSSRRLAEQLYILLLRIGYLPTIKRNRKRHEFNVAITGRQAYNLARMVGERREFVGKTTFNLFKRTKDVFLVPIRNISRKKYTGKVYNLEVEDDNSYVASIAMHNCGLEGFGYASLQAQACGVPVIGLNAGPTPEIVKYGALVKPAAIIRTPSLQTNAFPSPLDIADALQMIYDNPGGKFTKQRNETIEWVKQTFSWEVIMKKWFEHLDRIEEELDRTCVLRSRYPPKPSNRSLELAQQVKVLE